MFLQKKEKAMHKFISDFQKLTLADEKVRIFVNVLCVYCVCVYGVHCGVRVLKLMSNAFLFTDRFSGSVIEAFDVQTGG